MRVIQDENGRKDNIGRACLATQKQAKLILEMLNKANEFLAR